MIKKIPCGGFSYDDSEITFEDGVIHPIGGGGSEVVEYYISSQENETPLYLDKDRNVEVGYDTFRASLGKRVVLIDYQYPTGSIYFPVAYSDVSSEEWGYYAMTQPWSTSNRQYFLFGKKNGSPA